MVNIPRIFDQSSVNEDIQGLRSQVFNVHLVTGGKEVDPCPHLVRAVGVEAEMMGAAAA